MQAKKPLLIIGKGSCNNKILKYRFKKKFILITKFFWNFEGVAYGRAENEVRSLVYSTKIPFLPMPMAKGVVPDTDERCISSARTYVLQQSDVILLLGARLNWMLHFGKPPRFQPDVKIIQVL